MEIIEREQSMRLSYRNFALYHRNIFPFKRRDIIGVFKEKGTGNIVEGDNFSCIVVDDNAEKSYKLALEYFNYTRSKHEKEREFVSARWESETEVSHSE